MGGGCGTRDIPKCKGRTLLRCASARYSLKGRISDPRCSRVLLHANAYTTTTHMERFADFQEELVINGAAMNIELYGIESQILKLLSESEGNILDNTALIETLAEAKVREIVFFSPNLGPTTEAITIRRNDCLRVKTHLQRSWRRIYRLGLIILSTL